MLLQTGCQEQPETLSRGLTDWKQGVQWTTVIIVVIAIITGGPNKISSFLFFF